MTADPLACAQRMKRASGVDHLSKVMDAIRESETSQMINFTINCDALPGKEEELDRFVTNTMKTFWTKQQGVTGYAFLKDKLVGYPERTIRIDVKDLTALQRVLDASEWQSYRHQFISLLSRVESQILEPVG